MCDRRAKRTHGFTWVGRLLKKAGINVRIAAVFTFKAILRLIRPGLFREHGARELSSNPKCCRLVCEVSVLAGGAAMMNALRKGSGRFAKCVGGSIS